MGFKDLVTVFIPVFNAERYLEKAIESVLNQTYENLDILIINDGSTDSSSEIISKYSEVDSRIRFISRENKGICYTRNQGVKNCKGKYLALLDADDICMPQRIEKQVEFLKNNPSISVVGSSVYVIDKDDNILGVNKVKTKGEYIKASMITGSQIVNPSAMFNFEMVKQDLVYEKNYDSAEDLQLWLELYLKGHRFANLPDKLIKYRSTSTSLSHIMNEEKINMSARLIQSALYRSGRDISYEISNICSRNYSWKYILSCLVLLPRVKFDRYYFLRVLIFFVLVLKCIFKILK
ncbi:glycosyl transferase [Pseudoalteromonas sp. A25]|uniref:glycosyltransferase family 2 protein n=1 Tax=Pseudoalteromonas sp. A25 TaxID=116092 RepID=UPI001260C5B7|nr:glycosyltransferase family 2 protein [Pseudoalteromonas sp. A25]BBN82631.1 glycosyl transferase [Pseudoalteromonas sp. A25]